MTHHGPGLRPRRDPPRPGRHDPQPGDPGPHGPRRRDRAYGVAAGEPSALLVAYAAYWVGDVADGWLARRLGQETRLGAVLDIVCDRVCTVLLCAGLVAHTPAVAPMAVVFLLSFAVLDTMLSLAFLCWPIDTLNDFWRVDRRVYELNWSPLGKAVNTAGGRRRGARRPHGRVARRARRGRRQGLVGGPVLRLLG